MSTQTKEEFEQEVIDLFLNTKMSLRAIAQKYDRKSYDFIYSILNKYNISPKRRHVANKIKTEDIQKIVQLYQDQHMSARQIAKQYMVSGDVIIRVLAKNGIQIRHRYKQAFDEFYFDNIDTHNKAYLLGFLYADGCVNKNNVVSFSIQERDREILEMYVRELHATNEITKVKGVQHVRISFCSKHMCDTLINLGCVHNKTHNLSFPNIPSEYYYDFIRGFMDGDGCICLIDRGEAKYLNLSFTGTLDMMQTLKNIFNVDNRIRFYNGAYALQIGKTKDVLRILEHIYSSAELYLSRKFEKYQQYCEYIKQERKVSSGG